MPDAQIQGPSKDQNDRCLSGFRDKLYWRRVSEFDASDRLHARANWHCFKKTKVGSGRSKLVSLCQRHEIERSGGQAITRPIAVLRCALCDAFEMKRRGWDESGPETIDHQKPWPRIEDYPSVSISPDVLKSPRRIKNRIAKINKLRWPLIGKLAAGELTLEERRKLESLESEVTTLVRALSAPGRPD